MTTEHHREHIECYTRQHLLQHLLQHLHNMNTVATTHQHHQPHHHPPLNVSNEDKDGKKRTSIDHELLIITNDDSLQAVNVAYQQLAKELHPNKWTTLKLFTREEGSKRLKAIANAYKRIKTGF